MNIYQNAALTPRSRGDAPPRIAEGATPMRSGDLQDLPNGFHSSFVDCGEVRLHLVHNARAAHADGTLDDSRTPIIFLHGFPEFWAAWEALFPYLADTCLLIAPDQRGYNLSDAPQRISDYSVKKLVSDILALSSNLLGNRKFVLAGHDWGAAVAYSMAIAIPQRLKALIVANGVHPVPFQRALVEDEAQMAASQYFHHLTSENAVEHMSADNFRRAFAMFEKFSPAPWLTSRQRQRYAEAWAQPGRFNAMLNWYRASPVVVPTAGKPLAPTPLKDADSEKLSVKVPHLLVWGMKDPALLPVSRFGLERFAPKLEVIEIADADHWILHSHGERVATEIAKFIEKLD